MSFSSWVAGVIATAWILPHEYNADRPERRGDITYNSWDSTGESVWEDPFLSSSWPPEARARNWVHYK